MNERLIEANFGVRFKGSELIMRSIKCDEYFWLDMSWVRDCQTNIGVRSKGW